jgi:hypothetical protein
MTIPIRKDVPSTDIEHFCKKATRVTLAQLMDTVTVKEQLLSNGNDRTREYTIRMTLFPEEEYRSEHDVTPAEILFALGKILPVYLDKDIKVEFKKLGADLKDLMKEVGKGRKAPAGEEGATGGDGEDDEAGGDKRTSRRREEERSDLGDGDAEDEKRAKQGRQQATYESDDEGEVANEDYDENQAIEDAYAEDAEMSSDEEEEKDVVDTENDLQEFVDRARQDFFEKFLQASDFEWKDNACTITINVRYSLPFMNLRQGSNFSLLQYEADMPKLLLVGLIERACDKSVVREIPGITDCFAGKDEGKGVKVWDVLPTSSKATPINILPTFPAHHQWLELPRHLEVRCDAKQGHYRYGPDLLERHLCDPVRVRRRGRTAGDPPRNRRRVLRVQD